MRDEYVQRGQQWERYSPQLEPRGIVVERDGIRQRENGFGFDWIGSFDQLGGAFGSSSMASTSYSVHRGTSICEQLGYPIGSLDVVLVTARPQSTLAMLEPLAPLITPASTITTSARLAIMIRMQYAMRV